MFRSLRKNLLVYFFIPAGLFNIVLTSGFAQGPSTINEIEQLDFANGLFSRGLYDMSQAEYQKYLDLFKEGQYIEDAAFGIAECLFFKETYPPAIEAYQKYLTQFPAGKNKPVSLLRLGQAHFLTQQYDQALSFFQQVPREGLEPALLQALNFFIAKTYLEKGDDPSAVAHFTQAIALNDQKKYLSPSYVHLGDIDLKQKNFSQAKGHYHDAALNALSDDIKSISLYKEGLTDFENAKFEDAISTFQEVAKQFPNETIRSDALANLFLSYYKLGQWEKLVTDFEEYEKSWSNPETLFNAYYLAADAYEQLGKFDQAVALCEKTALFPALNAEDKNKILFKKTAVLVSAQRFEEALSFIDTQLKNLPSGKDETLFWEAESFFGLKNYDNAINRYQAITSEFPQSVFADQARYSLAYAQNAQGNQPVALQGFLDYASNGTDMNKRTEAAFNSLLIEIDLNLFKEAISHAHTFLTAFNDDQGQERILYLLGVIYNKDSQYEESTKTLQRYIEKFPQSNRQKEIYFLMGFNEHSQERNDKALQYYQMVSSDDKNDPFYISAQKNIALIHLKNNEPSKTAEIYDRLINETDNHGLGPDTYVWLAQFYLEDTKYLEKMTILSKLEARSDLTDQDKSVLAYLKAELYRNQRDFNNALKFYDESLSFSKITEYTPLAHIGKAQTFVELKKFDEAQNEYKTAIELNPENHSTAIKARFLMGTLQEMEENYEEAAKYFMLVAVLYHDPQYCPSALMEAGKNFEHLQKINEAKKAYEEIIESYQDSPLFGEAMNKLKELNEK